MPRVPWAAWVILALAVLILWAFIARALVHNPRGDVETGIVWHVLRLYSRFFHRMHVIGREHVPQTRCPGPLIVIVNHASGVDPILVQAAVPFEIRWVMAEDMRHPLGEWLWGWTRIIFVNRERPEVTGTREAIRHLRAGGVLGIFPEGGIERPPRRVLPFLPGVGFIIRQSRAPVLPVIVQGAPPVEPAWASLYRFSRSTVTFMPIMDLAAESREPAEIAQHLRELYMRWTGWPPVETP